MHPPPWGYPSPLKGSLPRLLQQEKGDAKTCLSSRMEGKCSASTSKRGQVEGSNLVQQHHLCAEGMKSQPGRGRQHFTSVAQDCQHGRFTSTSQKHATIQQGARPRYRLIQYVPLSASGSNPHPQDQTVSPALSTRQSCLS